MAHDLLAPWAEIVPDAPYPMTAADLARLPEDGRSYELVRGRLVRMPPTGPEHGDVAQDLGMALRLFVKSHKLGRVFAAETGFLVTQPGTQEETELAPDVSFVQADRLPPRKEWPPFLQLAPDLVAEVVSPSQSRPDMAKKAQEWLRAGARLVWIIWPKRQEVDVWLPDNQTPSKTLKIGDALDGHDVVPGFSYALADLFA